MRNTSRLFLALLLAVMLLCGCDWSVEAFRDGAQDFITDRTMMLLDTLFPKPQ